MKIYSDSQHGYGIIPHSSIDAKVSPEEQFSGWNLRKIGDIDKKSSDGIIILGEEETLYNYPLGQLNTIRKSISDNILIILVRSLYGARGSGKRSWINTQHDKSNLSMNFIMPNNYTSLHPYDLQSRIAVGIARTLKGMAPEIDKVTIQYPLHYLLNNKKVAGHLVEINKETIRIGLGVNTDFAPVLPENDELAQKLFVSSTSFHFDKSDWIRLTLEFLKNITFQLAIESHEEYLSYVQPKIGTQVVIYKDDGSIFLGSSIDEGILKEISSNGDVVLENGSVYNPNYHMYAV